MNNELSQRLAGVEKDILQPRAQLEKIASIVTRNGVLSPGLAQGEYDLLTRVDRIAQEVEHLKKLTE